MGAGSELVFIPADLVRSGELPRMCYRTGLEANDWYRIESKSRIGLQWLLLLMGVFPLILVRALTIRRLHGYLPINRQAFEPLHREEATFRSRRALYLSVLVTYVLCIHLLFLLVTDSYYLFGIDVPFYPSMLNPLDHFDIFRQLGAEPLSWTEWRFVGLSYFPLYSSIVGLLMFIGWRKRREEELHLVRIYLDRSGERLIIHNADASFAQLILQLEQERLMAASSDVGRWSGLTRNAPA